MAQHGGLTRREFLLHGGLATGGLVLAACTGSPGVDPTAQPPTPAPSPTSTPAPTASERPPVDDLFDALREVRTAVRASPDHLVARADDLVAAGDPEAIVAFVRDAIATHPPHIEGWAGARSQVRWGPRGTLRGGTGTPREKAELLAHLLERAGFDVELRHLREPRTVDAVAAPPAIFAPDITQERLDRLTGDLGVPALPVPDAIDDGGRDSAALADRLFDTLAGQESLAVVAFTDDPAVDLPTVGVTVAGERRVADLWSDGGLLSADQLPTSALFDDAPPAITVRFQAVTTAAPRDLVTLAEGTWEVDQLIGRRVRALLTPAATSLDELLAVSPASVTTFIPVLAVSAAAADPVLQSELNVVGDAVTSTGRVITEDPDTGTLRLGDTELTGDGQPAHVAMVEVRAVGATGFPSMTAEVRAVDDVGQDVQDLPASAFDLREQGERLPFVLERAQAPPSRVLFLLDTSGSIPEQFRGERYGASIRTISERLLDAQPDVQFRVATVSFEDADDVTDWTTDLDLLVQGATAAEGFGSALWQALADANKFGPTATVVVTDGRATVDGVSNDLLGEPSPAQRAAVARGAPALLIGVGDDIDEDMLELLGSTSGGQAFTVDDPDELVDAVAQRLADRMIPPYRLRWTAPTDGPDERRVTVGVPMTGASGEATYRVPPAGERALPEAIAGLYLEVEADRLVTRRHLAGLRDDTDRIGGDPPAITPAMLEEARRGLFGQYELVVEPSPPTMAHVLDDLVTARLSHEAVVRAVDDDQRRAAVEAGYATVDPNLWDVAAPVLADDTAPVTYELGPRLWVRSTRIVPGADSDAVRTSVDVLPHTRFATADPDPDVAGRATARQSLRIALAEQAFYTSSTAGLLADEDLAATASIRADLPDADPDAVDALARAARGWPWRHARRLVPGDGTPTALWVLDEETGTVAGVLADGSGGGSEVEDINNTFDDAASMLDTVNKLGDLSKFFGGPGLSFAFGVWADLEKTKLEKLRAATIMLATLDAPTGDIADLSDLAASLGDKVAEKGVEIMLPHLIGSDAAAEVGRLNDARKAWEAATGLLGVGAT